jgi:hypothetical protein
VFLDFPFLCFLIFHSSLLLSWFSILHCSSLDVPFVIAPLLIFHSSLLLSVFSNVDCIYFRHLSSDLSRCFAIKINNADSFTAVRGKYILRKINGQRLQSIAAPSYRASWHFVPQNKAVNETLSDVDTYWTVSTKATILIWSHSNNVVHHFFQNKWKQFNFWRKNMNQKGKGGLKDLSQITIFCYFIYGENNKIWEHRNNTEMWKCVYSIYNNNNKLYDYW